MDDIVYQIDKVRKQWFPKLPQWLGEVPDSRASHTYSNASLLCQGVSLFLFKLGSRNQMTNAARYSPFFKENFSRLFEGMEMAHPDTADNYYRSLKMEDLGRVRTEMVRSLIEKKRIDTFRGHYLVSIDGVCISTHERDLNGQLLHTTSPTGKRTYYHSMLEAKIVMPCGHAFSIGSEPISNEGKKDYEKQDCELNAFKRLCARIKKDFPRLPVCILADGLYANSPVMGICKENRWKYIITLKDGNLPSVQEQITDTEEAGRIRTTSPLLVDKKTKAYADSHYEGIEGLAHKGHVFNYVSCIEPAGSTKSGEPATTRFAHITNLSFREHGEVCPKLTAAISKSGRLRWKIENEGFNTQKNQGYNLCHKYARNSVEGMRIYYLLLQIAHIINQIVEKSAEVAVLRKKDKKLTFKFLWGELVNVMKRVTLCMYRLNENRKRAQIKRE